MLATVEIFDLPVFAYSFNKVSFVWRATKENINFAKNKKCDLSTITL